MGPSGSRPSLPAAVTIRDVGPRDGLQPEAPVPVAGRIRLVEALRHAGLRRIEAVALRVAERATAKGRSAVRRRR